MLEDNILKNGSDSNIKNPSYLDYGKERVLSFEFDLDGALAVGDKILGAKLPKVCKIKDAKFIAPNMGATGIFRLGLLNENSGEDYGLIPVADAGGQAVNERDGADSTLIGKVLGRNEDGDIFEDNNLIVECTEATVATAGKLMAFVTIIVE